LVEQVTDSELLTKVDAAIDYLLTGNAQSYTIAGREVTRLPLDKLYDMRKELRTAVSRSTGGLFVVAGVRAPR
jgi:hypothetical protein